PAPARKSRTSWFSGGSVDSLAPELAPGPAAVGGGPLCAALADAEPALCGVPAATEPAPWGRPPGAAREPGAAAEGLVPPPLRGCPSPVVAPDPAAAPARAGAPP